jgi:hypothetical protein
MGFDPKLNIVVFLTLDNKKNTKQYQPIDYIYIYTQEICGSVNPALFHISIWLDSWPIYGTPQIDDLFS